jgi:hypothetical protein
MCDMGGDYTGGKVTVEGHPASLRASMVSLLLPAFNRAFLRGLQTTSLATRRTSRSYNQEWKSPADEDARIAKMKDGRTHLAHKAEHAVDLDSGAVVGRYVTRRRSGRHHDAG